MRSALQFLLRSFLCCATISLSPLASRDTPPTPLGHGYVLRGDHIHFEGGGTTGVDGGTRIDEPSDANIQGFQRGLRHQLTLCTEPDAASFEALSEEYCRDQDNVYYKWTSPGKFLVVEIPGADARSFRALSTYYAADDNTVWYMDRPIPDSDPVSFTVIEHRTGKDRERVYVSGRPAPQLDAPSFRFLGAGYFADNNGVYWGIEPVTGADPGSFEVLGESFIAKDKHQVYRSGRVLDGLDPETTKLILHDPYEYQVVSDRNGVYVNGLRFLHADPADFVMRDTRCGVGGRFLFVVDVYHSTPVTVYRENGGLVVATVLYDRRAKRALATVRADLTEGGMSDLQLSPPPGEERVLPVPDWQLGIFQRPDLAQSLYENAELYLENE